MPEILSSTDQWLQQIAILLGYVPPPTPINLPNMYNAKFIIPSARVNTLNSNPFVLVTGILPTQQIRVISISHNYIFNSSVYDFGVNPYVSTYPYPPVMTAYQFICPSVFLNVNSDNSQIWSSNGNMPSTNPGFDLYISSPADSIAVGDSDLIIYVTYIIEDI